jgi:hypothetical protein
MAQVKQGGYRYHICVEGHIGPDWVDWPGDIDIYHSFYHGGPLAITLLAVTLPDQPALYGLLEKLRDLNLKLIYAYRDELISEIWE